MFPIPIDIHIASISIVILLFYSVNFSHLLVKRINIKRLHNGATVEREFSGLYVSFVLDVSILNI